MASFESVADEYDTGRPGYPDGVFDALGPVAGLATLDVGAGTGIATRALIARGARVVAGDHRSPCRRGEIAEMSLAQSDGSEPGSVIDPWVVSIP